MSEVGQKAKYSPGVDVFCCSPNNGHSTVHLSWVLGVLGEPANDARAYRRHAGLAPA
jgi:hypothetical protein